MSGDRHLARLLRLQRLHTLVLRRQAGVLARAHATALHVDGRLARTEALLAATGVASGAQHGAVLAGGAQLRALLSQAMAVQRGQAEAAAAARLAAAEAQQRMERRAERIAASVARARRAALAQETAKISGGGRGTGAGWDDPAEAAESHAKGSAP